MLKKRIYHNPVFLLPLRSALFFLFQALTFLILQALRMKGSWSEAGRWWPFFVALANTVVIFLLVDAFHAEGKKYWDLFRFRREEWKQDRGWLCLMIFVGLPLAFFPNSLLARFLYDDAMQPVRVVFQPLPLWAFIISFLFPLTIGLAELPVYFGYCMPRLADSLKKNGLAWLLSSLFLALQHCFIPLVFDGRYLIWRAGMYLPFALFTGWILWKRPHMMPYFAILHTLMDVSTMMVYLIPQG